MQMKTRPALVRGPVESVIIISRVFFGADAINSEKAVNTGGDRWVGARVVASVGAWACPAAELRRGPPASRVTDQTTTSRLATTAAATATAGRTAWFTSPASAVDRSPCPSAIWKVNNRPWAERAEGPLAACWLAGWSGALGGQKHYRGERGRSIRQLVRVILAGGDASARNGNNSVRCQSAISLTEPQTNPHL